MKKDVLFIKININSKIQEVYRGKKVKKYILDEIFSLVKNSKSVECRVGEYKNQYIVENVEVFADRYIYGEISVSSMRILQENQYDKENNGRLLSNKRTNIDKNNDYNIMRQIEHFQDNNKDIKSKVTFYCDVYNEIIAYYKDGQVLDILNVFSEILNADKMEPEFLTTYLTEGINIDTIREELRKMEPIEALKITIIPPNVDDEIINDVIRDGEKNLANEIKHMNITEYTMEFKSADNDGVNIDSEIIKNQLENMEKMHSKLSSKDVTSRGYIRVAARKKYRGKYRELRGSKIKYVIDTVKDKQATMAEVFSFIYSKLKINNRED